MAENRYSVDDILRELNLEKQERSTKPSSTSLYEDWGFDSQDRKDPAKRPATQERPRISQEPRERAANPTRSIPRRTPTSPRLGQTMTLPSDRDEREKILQNFDINAVAEEPEDTYDFPDAAYAKATTARGNGSSDWSRASTPEAPRTQPRQPQRTSSTSQPQRPATANEFYGGTNAAPRTSPNGRRAIQYGKQDFQPNDIQRAPRQDSYNPSQPRQSQMYGGYTERQFSDSAPISRRPIHPSDQSPVPPRTEHQPLRQTRSTPPPEGRRYPRSDSLTGEYSVARRQSMANAAKMLTGGLDELDEDYDTKVTNSNPPTQSTNKRVASSGGLNANPARMQTQRFSSPTQSDQDFFGEAPQTNATNNVSAPQFGNSNTLNFTSIKTDEEDDSFVETLSTDSHNDIVENLHRMRIGLVIRMVTNIIAVAAVIYLSLAGEYSLPLPSIMVENAGILLWTELIVLIISALVSGNTIGGGILSLLKLKPSNDSYTALAVFACLLQGGYMALQPQLIPTYGNNIYLPLAALLLLFNSLGKVVMLSRIEGSYQFVSKNGDKYVVDTLKNRELSKHLACDIISGEVQIGYATKAKSLNEFLDEAFSESKAEDISKIIAPMTALAALLMALLSYLFTRDIFSSACVYTGALCITAPLASVIASNLPLSITNGKLARFGATICGYNTVGNLAETNEVILSSTDLFPKGSVRIKDIKILDRRPIDQVVLDASSVLSACNNSLTDIFKAMIPDSSILPAPESLEYLDNMGMSAWVNGRRVLIGNRQLMQNYGIQLPDISTENQYKNENDEVLYLSNSGIAAAMYIISYKPDKKMRRTLELLCDSDIAVCVHSTDPNVTKERIGRLYSFPTELITVVPGPLQHEVKATVAEKETSRATAVCTESSASSLRCILAAKSCSRCITIETALILMSVVIGFAIVTFFAFTKQMASLTWVTLTVYQFFWLLIELLIPLTKH